MQRYNAEKRMSIACDKKNAKSVNDNKNFTIFVTDEPYSSSYILKQRGVMLSPC